ncbi:unnamed protein product [Paramecium sonneborni]|uniref:Dynamin N-terminal domain-containing protein n=1 Tax=Paramecium sonneborni TaxID=65129 RepID=A0A8S1R663_9CILI|nr:unnamed protein product [Paramecium sonneborni]
MNYILKFFQKEQPKPTEPLFFQKMNEKIQEFQTMLNIIPDGVPQAQYATEIIQQINSSIKDLTNYIQSNQFYIIFLGTTSAGKSTFINSLLGQQILPSRNQECTQTMIFISYNEKIVINGNVYGSLAQAQQTLFEMQKNNNQQIQEFETINLQVPSLFHQQLPPDLRNKIIFVDTPGIKISEYKSYETHFQFINDKLLSNTHRINLWICNYTTFDNDKEFQNQIIKFFSPQLQSSRQVQRNSYLQSIIIEDYSVQQQQQLLTSYNPIIDSNAPLFSAFKPQLAALFFIINKFDEKKGSEDKNIDVILKEISDKIGNQNKIFKISALRAMRYRILNYGNKQAIDKFIESYYQDYKDVECFLSLDDCRKYCDQKIKNNPNLLQNQDYEEFNKQLIQSIQKEICETFYGDIYVQTTYSLVFLDLIMNCSQIMLDQQQFENLSYLINKFINLQITNYSDYLSNLKECALKSIKMNLDYYRKSQIEDRQMLIISACKSTLPILIEFETKILELNDQIKDVIIKKLQSIFPQQKKNDIFESVQIIGQKDVPIVEGCLQLFKILSDNKILEISKSSFEQYSESIQKTMGVRINPIQQQVGIISTGLSIVTFLGKRFALQTLAYCPIFAAIGLGLMSFDLNFLFGKSWYSENIVISRLNQWESQLIQQIEEQKNNYCKINKQTLLNIKNLLSSLIS